MSKTQAESPPPTTHPAERVRVLTPAEAEWEWVGESLRGESNESMPSRVRRCMDAGELCRAARAGCGVLVGDEVVAVLEFVSAQVVPPQRELVAVLAHIGTQLGRVAERERARQSLTEAIRREQRLVGRELHDTTCPQLTGIGLLIKGLLGATPPESPAYPKIEQTVELLARTTRQLRAISRGLFPVEVDAEGLPSALYELARNTCERYGIECDFEAPPGLTLRDNNVATQIYRIAQESIRNAVKHSEASRVILGLEVEIGTLRLTVLDDGAGFGENEIGSSGMGMWTMRYRADSIGASLTVQSGKGRGTRVVCSVWLPA